VRDGITPDMEYLPVIFEASESDDPFAESTWAKANPKYPKTPKKAYLESQAKKAQENPRFLNTFLRLHLNIRTNSDVAWFGVEQWNACGQAKYGALRDSLRGETCTGGLDLSTTTDLTAFSLFFPERSALLCWFWMPRDTAVKAEKRDRVPYLTWERQGFVEMTDGNVVDHNYVEDRVTQICGEFNPSQVGYDQWNAEQMAVSLSTQGLNMTKMIQGYKTLSEPSKELERLVVSGQLEHGGHPVLAWNASNVMLREDPAGNIKPDKSKSTGRIDGVVAGIMAIGLAITTEGPASSVYEKRGILIL
jgi:phage terminase large subunit-like protein